MALLLLAPLASADTGSVGSLAAGQDLFWEGSAVPSAANGSRTYLFGVTNQNPSSTLRVALDRRDYRINFQLVDPSGRRHSPSGGWYGREVFVDAPVNGIYRVEATGSTSPRPFRFRARLDGSTPLPPEPVEAKLPNLKMVPPHEFTFAAPGFGIDSNCSIQETVEEEATGRCLRFSMGPANLGDGPLFIRFAPLEGVVTEGTAYQRVYDSGGGWQEREAGTFEYHKTHMHYHHSGFGRSELFRVLDVDSGEMDLVGLGPKQGFCTGDVMMADWFGFTQPRHGVDSGCVDEAASTGTTRPLGTTMALNTGWADLYSWSQDGMYVDWSQGTDGLYLVRAEADSEGWINESNEADNASYALIEITGEEVRVLERGYGDSPWDPTKQLVDDRLPHRF
jgi:hypothetical protein